MMDTQSIIRRSKLKVLYIDDNPLDLQIILNQLSHKFEITFANNGREALFYGTQTPLPDIFLIDIHMPSMNGFELCEKFLTTPETAHIPIIFITSNDKINSKTRAFKLGCIDYIVKPIDAYDLGLRINNHVKLARQSHYIKTLASIVPKTNFNNYYKYLETLKTEWDICKRYDYSLTLLICEIDKIKDISLSLTQEQMYDLISPVADSIRNIGHRPGDSISHIDTATFAIILSDSQINHAVNCAKEVIARISTLQISTSPKSLPIQISASIGISSLYPEGNKSMMVIHENAQKALTEVNRRGGNDWYMHSLSQVFSN